MIAFLLIWFAIYVTYFQCTYRNNLSSFNSNIWRNIKETFFMRGNGPFYLLRYSKSRKWNKEKFHIFPTIEFSLISIKFGDCYLRNFFSVLILTHCQFENISHFGIAITAFLGEGKAIKWPWSSDNIAQFKTLIAVYESKFRCL